MYKIWLGLLVRDMVVGKVSVRYRNNRNFLVAMRLGVTPVPISNTMVKTQAADDTALETVWESRWPPNLKKNEQCCVKKKRKWICGLL